MSGSGPSSRPENLRWESRTVADVMAETGHDALDVICDLLLAEDLGVSQVTSGPWAETLPRFVAHPVGMVGTDSTFLGDKPSPRTYGSFPRILGQFVRDEALLSLEEAVRKMTSAPAARLGLRDRGTIRDGAVADLVVFDPATVRSTATYDEPRSYPVGIEQVIVAGTPVVVGRRAHRRACRVGRCGTAATDRVRRGRAPLRDPGGGRWRRRTVRGLARARVGPCAGARRTSGPAPRRRRRRGSNRWPGSPSRWPAAGRSRPASSHSSQTWRTRST